MGLNLPVPFLGFRNMLLESESVGISGFDNGSFLKQIADLQVPNCRLLPIQHAKPGNRILDRDSWNYEIAILNHIQNPRVIRNIAPCRSEIEVMSAHRMSVIGICSRSINISAVVEIPTTRAAVYRTALSVVEQLLPAAGRLD